MPNIIRESAENGAYMLKYLSSNNNFINGGKMNRVSHLSMVISFFMLVFILPDFSQAATYTVSGTISLPNDFTPLTYDTTIEVNLLKWDSAGNPTETLCDSPILPANATEISYSCDYSDADGMIGIGVIPSISGIYYSSYYNSSSTVFASTAATKLLSSQNNPGTDITLLRLVTASGRLTTPDEQTFPEPHEFFIHYQYRLPGSSYYNFWFGNQVTLPAGTNSVDYSMNYLPEGTDVRILYQFNWGIEPPSGIYREGYYSSTGTKYEATEATALNLTEDRSNIDLTWLKATTISGSFLLQGGDSFAQDTNVWVYASTSTGEYITGNSFTPAQDANSAAFSLSIPANIASFKVHYSFWPTVSPYLNSGNIGRIAEGFALTPCEEGTELTLSDNLTDLSLALSKYPSVSGTVSLPDTVSASVDIPLEIGLIYADRDGKYSDTNFSSQSQPTIAAGQNSTPYSVQVDPSCDSNNLPVVGYRHTSNDYVRYGYYSESGIVGDPNHASQFAFVTNETYEDIVLQLIPGTRISGIISLPNGISSPAEGLPITLGALADPGGMYHTTVTIPSESQSVNYSVRVAPDVGDVALGYWLPEELPVASRGYYRLETVPDRVTGRYGAADKLNHDADILEKDFTLGQGNTVSGSIQLPAAISRVVPIEIKLAEDLTNPESNYWHTSIVVPESSQSVSYSRRVLLDSTAKMKFSNNYIDVWAPYGYFLNSSGSTAKVSEAAVLQPNEDHLDTNFFLAAMLPGDINFDGQINLTDVILSLRVFTKAPLDENGFTKRADVNNDEKLGLEETIYIMKEVASPTP